MGLDKPTFIRGSYIRAGGGQFYERDRLYSLQISGSIPPFISSFSSTNGRILDNVNLPPACTVNGVTNPNCFSTGLGFPNVGNELSNHVPNSWQFRVGVQRELCKDTVLDVSYVGNRGIHLLMHNDINAVAPADRVAYFQDNGCPGTPTNNPCGANVSNTSARSALRPFGSSPWTMPSPTTPALGNRTTTRCSLPLRRVSRATLSSRLRTPGRS